MGRPGLSAPRLRPTTKIERIQLLAGDFLINKDRKNPVTCWRLSYKVIRQAYAGLFQLVSSGLFDKYVDFIDTYAEIRKQEQQELYNEIVQHKETAMLAQYIRNKGIEQGIIKKAKKDIINILELRFGKVPYEIIKTINRTDDLKTLDSYFKQGVQVKGLDQLSFL